MGLITKGIPSTQQHLDVADIKRDLVVLKNGVVSLILETTSLNFDLLSEREQDAKILAFAGMLNSLSFHIQISIRTKRTDLSDYVEQLREQRKRQLTEGLRHQMDVYIEFIKNLTVTNEVLEKRFFIVIPSSSGVSLKPGFFKRMLGKSEEVVNVDEAIERAVSRLYPRRDHIVKQLKKMGLFANQLTSEQLVKLFYGIYNPGRGGIENVAFSNVDIGAALTEAKTQ